MKSTSSLAMHRRDETRTDAGTLGYPYLKTSNVAAKRTVEFVPSRQLTSGSTQKAIQAIRLVTRVFRRRLECVVTQRSGSVAVTCPEAAEADIMQVCAIAEQRLARLQQELPTAKMVEEILAITPVERRRWSKDGRLPNAGQALFSQGRKQVGLFLYPPNAILQLAAHPDQIADWRRRDSGTPTFHRQSPSPH